MSATKLWGLQLTSKQCPSEKILKFTHTHTHTFKHNFETRFSLVGRSEARSGPS